MKQLNNLCTQFLCNIFGVNRRGCPEVALYLETAFMRIENRILLSQLQFLRHVISMDNDTLVTVVYWEQKDKSLPCLFSHCEEVLREWNIELNSISLYSKNAWAKFMKQKVAQLNHDQLIKWCRSYKKVDYKAYEKIPLNIQLYLKTLNLVDGRKIFRRNCQILSSIRLNQKGNKAYKSEDYMCPNCLSLSPPERHPDSQEEILNSSGNLDLQVRDISDL